MKTEKYRQLSEVHLMQRIWRSELELALLELDFWEDLLDTLNQSFHADVTDADTWRVEIGQLHHFRRLSKRLLGEIEAINGEVAIGVRIGQVMDKESRLDHQYLRREMDSFHADFRAFKTEIRQFMVVQPTF